MQICEAAPPVEGFDERDDFAAQARLRDAGKVGDVRPDAARGKNPTVFFDGKINLVQRINRARRRGMESDPGFVMELGRVEADPAWHQRVAPRSCSIWSAI